MTRHLKLLLITVSLITASALSLNGCSTRGADPGQGAAAAPSAEDKQQDPSLALVVATVGSTKLTVGDLNDEINRQNPYIRMRIASTDRKKDFLKKMIRFEVLAAEARRKNFDQDPEVIRRAKRAMIDQLMADLNQNLVKMEDITDQEIEAYYKANLDKYHQPPMVRVSQMVLGTRAAAQRILAMANKKPGDSRKFIELVRQHTEDEAGKARGGDLGFFDQKNDKIPAEVIEAAFAIEGMWQLSGPVKVGDKFILLMKTGAREAVNKPLELESARIKNRLFQEKRIKATENFIEQLQAKAKVEINEENLSKVKADMTPPSAGPGARRLGIKPSRHHPPARQVVPKVTGEKHAK